MDRSEFYFRQLVTHGNLDTVFNDVERTEQERTIDADTWGIWQGLGVAQQAVPDLTIVVGDGVAHDELGRRIECPANQTVDLSTYLPATPGNTLKAHIYVENADIVSDPRIDGDGLPLDYRHTESFQIAIVAGTEGVPGAAPAIVANRVLLAEVTLTQGQTTILDADIATGAGQCQPGGIPWRRGRLITDDLVFDVTTDYSILGPRELAIKTGTPADTGISCGDTEIIEIGKMTMSPLADGGLGLDMNDRPIGDAVSFNLLAGGVPGTDTGIACSERDIIDVGKLIMTLSSASGLGIAMGGTDIETLDELRFQAAATGIGGSTDPLPVTVSLDLGTKDIVKTTQVQADEPIPTNSKGFIYTDPSTGTIRDIAKYWSCDASQMFPGGQTDQHAHDGNNLNGWYIDDIAIAGLTVAGDAGWRMNFTANDGDNKPALYVPLVGIPHGAKLISANVSYTVLSSPHANHYLRLYLLRRNHGAGSSTVGKLGNTPPSNERQATNGNYSWTESFVVSQTVNMQLYAYFLAIVHHAAGGLVPQEDTHRIRSATVTYHIREASGVY